MMPLDHESVTLLQANSMDRPSLFFTSNINQEAGTVCEEFLCSQGVCSLTIVTMGS
jgi:hypothetical protein